jgi:hypothetical protein
MAPELANPFSHPRDTHTNFADGRFEEPEPLLSDALAVVLNLELKLIGISSKSNSGSGRSGMAMDIGQTLLKYAEERKFNFSGRPSQTRCNFTLNVDAASSGEPFSEPTRG